MTLQPCCQQAHQMLPPLHSLAPMQQQAAAGGAAFLQPPPMGPPAGMQPQPVHYMQPAHGMAYASPAGAAVLAT
jgi:hypothetical protein